MEDFGMYIHIPFCKRKCEYCDFNSYVASEDKIDDYLISLKKEMCTYLDRYTFLNINSIFIGGGTPTHLSELQLEELLSFIKDNIDIEKVKEYTVECNPGTLNSEKLKIMKYFGVNRLSIGLQSTHEKHLKLMGRIHSFDEFLESYEMARDFGFDNINIDLIFAFENQRFDEWKDTLKLVTDLNPQHISAYSLIIEEGTKFHKMYEDGLLKDFPEEDYLKMYRYTVEFLKSKGYNQYEISNYCKDDSSCLHNNIYWDGKEYLGLGAGASGHIQGVRYTNVKNLDEYKRLIEETGISVDFSEKLSPEDVYNERIIFGLRKNIGINIEDAMMDLCKSSLAGNEEIMDKLDDVQKKIDYYIELGYLSMKGKIISLTQSGREISNSIFLDLMII